MATTINLTLTVPRVFSEEVMVSDLVAAALREFAAAVRENNRDHSCPHGNLGRQCVGGAPNVFRSSTGVVIEERF